MDNMLYTVHEVAKIMKTNPGYVYRLIRAGLIPVLKLGSLKVRKESLYEFLVKYEGKDLTNPEEVKELDLEGPLKRKEWLNERNNWN